MPAAFKFLSTAEFERLSPAQKLAYLSDAMEELERAKIPRDTRGWHSLFTRTQEQQQPQPSGDPTPE